MLPLKGSAPSPNRPYVTLGLIGLNIAAFLFELSLPDEALRRVVFQYGFIPARFWAALESQAVGLIPTITPLFTSIFMHGGWGHLAGNMLFLWVFGDGVENRIGKTRFLGFYLLVGILASLTHGVFAAGTTLPTVGASGAVAGVLGAYLLLYPKARVLMFIPIFFWPLFFEIPAMVFLIIWFFEQFFFGAMTAATRVTGETGGVAWWAHIGGFVFGALLSYWMAKGVELPDYGDGAHFEGRGLH